MHSGMRERAVLPSKAALADARSAWSRGDFNGCIAGLDEIGALPPRSAAWVEATLLRARSLYRLRRYDETIALLEPVLREFADGDESCTAHMLLGSSIARSGDVDRGLEILETTAAQADAAGVHRAIRAEIAHARALGHWARRELDEAERLARIAEGAGADIISVRATQLRGFVALAQQRLVEALALFNLTFDAYWRCRERDADLAEMIVHQIAVLEIVLRSRTVHGTHAIPDRRRVRDPWDTTPDAPSVARLQTAALDAWLFALDGDRDSAFRKIRRAEEMAAGRSVARLGTREPSIDCRSIRRDRQRARACGARCGIVGEGRMGRDDRRGARRFAAAGRDFGGHRLGGGERDVVDLRRPSRSDESRSCCERRPADPSVGRLRSRSGPARDGTSAPQRTSSS